MVLGLFGILRDVIKHFFSCPFFLVFVQSLKKQLTIFVCWYSSQPIEPIENKKRMLYETIPGNSIYDFTEVHQSSQLVQSWRLLIHVYTSNI